MWGDCVQDVREHLGKSTEEFLFLDKVRIDLRLQLECSGTMRRNEELGGNIDLHLSWGAGMTSSQTPSTLLHMESILLTKYAIRYGGGAAGVIHFHYPIILHSFSPKPVESGCWILS